MIEQLDLFGKRRLSWEEHWAGMPDFVQENLSPEASSVYDFPDGKLYVHFASLEDQLKFQRRLQAALPPGKSPTEMGRPWFSEVVEQDVATKGMAQEDRKRTQSVWWPEAEIGRIANKRWITAATVNPLAPIFIVSKGRWPKRYTSSSLAAMGIPHHIIVEPQEAAVYRDAIAADGEDNLVTVLELDMSYKARDDKCDGLGLEFSTGPGPARNFAWDTAVAEGHEWHWVMDDNINDFYRLTDNLKVETETGACFRAMEAFCARYDNVTMAGPNYFMFASRKTSMPPYVMNTRIYSCNLIRNSAPFRWRGRYNEDTDLSLQMMKAGFATVQFNAFLQMKLTTQTVKGGNTAEFYEVEGGGTFWKSLMQVQLWPRISQLVKKWGRWHHQVDYSSFTTPLKSRDGFVLPELDTRNQFGMTLRIAEPKPREKKVKIEIMPTIEPAPKVFTPDEIPDLDGIDLVAFDYETTGLRWWAGDRPVGLAVAWWQGATIESRYLPFAHAGGNLPEERVREFANDLRHHRLGAHNAKFDHHHGREWGANLTDVPTTDTMHIGALLDDHRRNNKLDTLGLEYLGVGKVRGPSLSQGAGIFHAAQIAEYARRDAELVLRLIDHTKPMIEAQGLERILALESRCLWPVIEMERNAFPIDQELLADWQRSSATDLAKLEMELFKVAGFRCNVDSPTDMQRLFEKRGLVNKAMTDAGNASFAATALAEFKDDEGIGLAIKVGKMTDLRNKALDAYPRQLSPDGLMRYSLNQLRGDQYGTISGRFSASQASKEKDEGCNPQQVMTSEKAKKHYGDRYNVRRLWIPAPGKLLLADDAAQVEFRFFAHYANSPALIKAYADDPRVDFHQALTDVAQEFNEGITRKLVKNINFALVFGAGVKKTAEMLGVSVSESKEFVRQYNQAFPEAKAMLRMASSIAKSRGYVKTILGRRSRFPGGERTHKALNSVIQGSNGDYQKLKACELYDAREELGFTMRLTVHDEFVGDVHDEEGAKKVHALLERQTLDVKVPLLWDYGTGANWAEAK